MPSPAEFTETLVIEAGLGYFDGHFPGQPILPGVAQLDLAARALAVRGTGLAGVASLRLRQLVGPGDVLALKVTAGRAGEARFELRRGADLVSNGTLLTGEPAAGAAGGATAPPAPAAGDDLPAEALLPHVPPARLVESVRSFDDDGVAAVARIPAGSPFVVGGAAPALLGLEIAAQAAAAYEALARRRAGGPAAARLGYLVSARDAAFLAGRLPVEAPLDVTVRRSGSAPPLSTYELELARGGHVLVTGTIGTWLA